jgi:hypothetical protein
LKPRLDGQSAAQTRRSHASPCSPAGSPGGFEPATRNEQVPGLLSQSGTSGVRGHAGQVDASRVQLDEEQHVETTEEHVSTVKKSVAKIAWAWFDQKVRQFMPPFLPAGPMPSSARTRTGAAPATTRDIRQRAGTHRRRRHHASHQPAPEESDPPRAIPLGPGAQARPSGSEGRILGGDLRRHRRRAGHRGGWLKCPGTPSALPRSGPHASLRRSSASKTTSSTSSSTYASKGALQAHPAQQLHRAHVRRDTPTGEGDRPASGASRAACHSCGRCSIARRRGWRGVAPAVVRGLYNLRRELIQLPGQPCEEEVVDEAVTAAA